MPEPDCHPAPTDASAPEHSLDALFSLLGRRWVLRILWHLDHGGLKFRELQAACDQISPSVLNQRLRDLRAAGLVTHRRGLGYQLTMPAHDLADRLLPLQEWAKTSWPAPAAPDR